MNPVIPEANFPADFRPKDTTNLANLIKANHSICLVGMKKVGISVFLRFFYYHPKIRQKYFPNKNYLFAFVDLNDLLKASPKSFWILTLKRVNEAVSTSQLSPKVKKEVDKLFLQAISSREAFFFFDNLKKSIQLVVSSGIKPVLFFSRFDRLAPVFSLQFFNNLQSLKDTAKFNSAFIFTSVRPLPYFFPKVFKALDVSRFSNYFLKPVNLKDLSMIGDYLLLGQSCFSKLNTKKTRLLYHLGGGHLMLTRLLLMNKRRVLEKRQFGELLKDERIKLCFEEIWENLSKEEKEFWDKDYLFQTGILTSQKDKLCFFSHLFAQWIKDKIETRKRLKEKKELTYKEKRLFDCLKKAKNKVCSRDKIIKAVWPEYLKSDDLAVSDWAIDRLVSRVRKKLKSQGEKWRILTIRGRGHKLVLLS